jgi:hypothetical protein
VSSLGERLIRGSDVLVLRAWAVLWPGEWREAVQRWCAIGVVGSFPVTAVCLHPWLLAPAAGGWAAAALAVSKQAGDKDEDSEDEPVIEGLEPEELGDAEFVAVLRAAIGDRNGVLLRDVAVALEEAGLTSGWTPADVRQQCDACGIPVKESIKVSGETSVGVHRLALPAAPPAASEGGQVVGSSAGQGSTTSPTAYPATPVVERHESGMTIVRHPAEDRRYTP